MMFKYEQRARQLIDFSNLSWSYIHPTDIDATLEFDNYKLILFEYKTANKAVDYGQRLLLERIADTWNDARIGNTALVIVAEHYTEPTDIVDGGMAIVRALYYKGKWFDYTGKGRTVRSVVQNYAKEDILRKTEQIS